MLTRYRYHVVHNLAREKAYCLSVLYLKASEYTRPEGKPFAHTFGATSCAVLQEFATMDEVAALPFLDLVEFIDVKGKRRFPDPTDNARRLQQVARDSYQLPRQLQESVQLVLGMSFQYIAHLERQLKRLDTAITQHMDAFHHSLQTIPGFGPVFCAGILAEIGDIARFDFDQAKVANYAGLKWRKTQSANFTADESPMTRKGNRFLRYYFCEAANIVRMCDADYRAFYDRKYKEVRKHQHKRALVLTARKLVRLVVRLLTTNQPYRPRSMPI
jgi:transposase